MENGVHIDLKIVSEMALLVTCFGRNPTIGQMISEGACLDQ